jgi:predicted helicase
LPDSVTSIPLEAWDYVVNSKSALDRVVERQCVKAAGLKHRQ